MVEFVGSGGEVQDGLAAAELGGVDSGDEIALNCVLLFVIPEILKSIDQTGGLQRPDFFLSEIFIDRWFLRVDHFEAPGNLAGVLGIDRIDETTEMIPPKGFDGRAHTFINHNASLAGFLAEMNGIQVRLCGFIGAALEFSQPAFGDKSLAHLSKGDDGGHVFLDVIDGVVIRKSGFVGESLAEDIEGGRGITD